MSIEKYLDNVRVPVSHPGPFSAKLKHDLKQELFARRRTKETLLVISSSFSLALLVVLALIIYNPQMASDIQHFVLVRTGFFEAEDLMTEQQLAEQRQSEIVLPDEGRYLGYSHQVSQTAGTSPYQIMELSQLNEETPYLIRKVRDRNNRYIYFISEVDNPRSGRVLY